MNTDVSPIISRSYYIKQSDSNWKSIKLGNYTIGEKGTSRGCYVCSIAMTICWYLEDDSVETKKAVLKKLAANCSSSGSYNGGSITYNDRTFKPMKIADMAQELLNGYPAICQVGKDSDHAHFVVVNGYDTDNTGYEAYLVLDPGWDYDNLQEVMDEKGSENILSRRFVQEL